MSITLEEAKNHLKMWLEAEEKVAVAGQIYKIADRQLERADLKEIGERIKYWSGMVSKLEGGGSTGARGHNINIFDI